jgi:hypothetical protein
MNMKYGRFMASCLLMSIAFQAGAEFVELESKEQSAAEIEEARKIRDGTGAPPRTWLGGIAHEMTNCEDCSSSSSSSASSYPDSSSTSNATKVTKTRSKGVKAVYRKKEYTFVECQDERKRTKKVFHKEDGKCIDDAVFGSYSCDYLIDSAIKWCDQ